jgi:hypothetical protein
MAAQRPVHITHDIAATLALQALAFIMADERLRERFIDLSGVTAADLRERLDDDTTLAAILSFLALHEPDLLACAAALLVPADQLMQAVHVLQGSYD